MTPGKTRKNDARMAHAIPHADYLLGKIAKLRRRMVRRGHGHTMHCAPTVQTTRQGLLHTRTARLGSHQLSFAKMNRQKFAHGHLCAKPF
jgi:hypothetical protein